MRNYNFQQFTNQSTYQNNNQHQPTFVKGFAEQLQQLLASPPAEGQSPVPPTATEVTKYLQEKLSEVSLLCENQRLQTIATQLQTVAAIAAKSSNKKTLPIQFAARNGLWQAVRFLMPTTEDREACSKALAYSEVLLYASKDKQYDLAKTLLTENTNTTWHFHSTGYFAIHYAIAANDSAGNDMLKTLLRHKANPNSQHTSEKEPEKKFPTPLEFAFKKENPRAIALLLKHDATPDFHSLEQAKTAAKFDLAAAFMDNLPEGTDIPQTNSNAANLRSLVATLEEKLQKIKKDSPAELKAQKDSIAQLIRKANKRLKTKNGSLSAKNQRFFDSEDFGQLILAIIKELTTFEENLKIKQLEPVRLVGSLNS